MSNIIIQNVRRQHASVNTVYHALYGYYFLGISKKQLAIIYGKCLSTICSWFSKYERNGLFHRKQREQIYKKFTIDMRSWLIQLYMKEPMLFLDEAKLRFQLKFHTSISLSSICAILHEFGLTRKTIERRAIQIRDEEIVRFVKEMMSIKWDIYNLVFLDEVSFDSRDMLRRKGYGVIGQKVVYRGEFCRKPRVSFLCFLGMSGILDSFWTQGTFTRAKFFECCRDFALHNKQVQRYPGFHSIWIMDGARIHCDPNLIRYLRSIGIIPIFLPAYCPFFNPIEVIFGLIKKDLIRNRPEHSSILHEVCESINRFKIYLCTNIFEHSGYFAGGTFLPEKGLDQDINSLDFIIDNKN
ncbi:uncharacterized protein LOC128745932 [Sabethes cyaneus]|uniref:uncharacterized protein LOC128745932 n=1 Tax=Sabethes cyaneus TaxID=53552 RepID=UPI00237E077F|nr:uncharacterized protein LOC128745932 [Sabethes cyaneus]